MTCVCGHARAAHGGATGRGACTVTFWGYCQHTCACSRFVSAESPEGRRRLEKAKEAAARSIALDDEGIECAPRPPATNPAQLSLDLARRSPPRTADPIQLRELELGGMRWSAAQRVLLAIDTGQAHAVATEWDSRPVLTVDGLEADARGDAR